MARIELGFGGEVERGVEGAMRGSEPSPGKHGLDKDIDSEMIDFFFFFGTR